MEYIRPLDFVLLFLAYISSAIFSGANLLSSIPAGLFLIAVFLYRLGVRGEVEKIYKPESIFAKGIMKPTEVIQLSIVFLVLSLVFAYFLSNPVVLVLPAIFFFFSTKLRYTTSYLATVLDFFGVFLFLIIPGILVKNILQTLPVAIPVALLFLTFEILEDLKHPYTVANANIPRLLGIKRTKQIILPFIAIFSLWTYAPVLVGTKLFFFGPIALGFALSASYAIGYEKYEDGRLLLWLGGIALFLSLL